MGSRFAISRIEIDPDQGIDCGICAKFCPMNIKLLTHKNANQRILSTECIICITCVNVCPKSGVALATKSDLGGEEHLAYRERRL